MTIYNKRASDASTKPAAKWRQVCAENLGVVRNITSRMRVPGGWLYREQVQQLDPESMQVALCFIPDSTGDTTHE
ncbi:MAG: hypothetical protein ABSH20_06020 [Tepidisphaeraceae bacterium]|jgi:hypothetical protein